MINSPSVFPSLSTERGQGGEVKYVIGLDIGGSSIVGAVIEDQKANILSRESIATDAARGPADGVRRIGELIHRLITQANLTLPQISGIGIGCTGPVDPIGGRVQNPYTLPTWDDVPLVEMLAENFTLPILLIGDCDVAALGEHWIGAGQGSRTMLYLTFGTGIGGGIISEGHLHRGVRLVASEPGHMALDPNGPLCYCGARGCFEMYAAGPAIARFAGERATADGLMRQLAGDQPITAKIVAQAAQAGDSIATELIRQTALYIGLGLGNLMNIIAPEIVVLGGGVMTSWPLFEPVVMETLKARDKMIPYDQIAIRPAKLGLNAGVTGAARAILDQLH